MRIEVGLPHHDRTGRLALLKGAGTTAVRYTIAIPAFNEAAVIGRLLEFLRCHAPPTIEAIVVCDSLSDDDTASIVLAHARADPRIRLVRAERPGKPSAWNVLMAEATSRGVVFLDADTLPARLCLPRLLAAFEAGSALVVGSRRTMASDGPTIAARVAARLFDPVVELCLVGNCYVIDRPAILERMRRLGLDAMPDVFAEDIWLQSILERGEFEACQQATIALQIDSFAAYRLLHARKKLVAYELAEIHPRRGVELDANFPEVMAPFAQARQVVRTPLSVAVRARWFAGAAAKLATNLLWSREINRIAEGLTDVYRRSGGSHVLRYDGSTSRGRSDPVDRDRDDAGVPTARRRGVAMSSRARSSWVGKMVLGLIALLD